MRIVGGNFKGKKLQKRISKNIRPTSEFVREAIFDILENYLDFANKNVLDLFAGTGLLGIEALSRGADFCQFVDKSKSSIEILKSFLEELAVEKSKYKITHSDVFSFLNTYQNERKFNVIFADPPYETNLFKKLIENPNLEKVAKKGTIFVVETHSKFVFENVDWLELKQKKIYGDTAIFFFQYK